MAVKTRDLSESGFFVFVDPAPPVGELLFATLSLDEGEQLSLAVRVKYRIPEIGVALDLVADASEPGSISRYLEFAGSLLDRSAFRHIGESSILGEPEPISFEQRPLRDGPPANRNAMSPAKEARMTNPDDQDNPRTSSGPVSVSRRPSEAPPPFPKGGVIELLYEAWTPFNGIVERHLAELVGREFTEERVYALEGTPRAVRFLQTVDLAVLDPETLAERSGVPFYDGSKVGVLFVDGVEGAPMRALERGMLIRLSNRAVPFAFEEENQPY